MTTKSKIKTPAKRVSIPVARPLYQRCARVAEGLKGSPSTAGLIVSYVEAGVAADEAKKEGA